MGAETISVPIVKDGKDICRLIFTRFDDGLFDVKIDPLRKPFHVQAYSMLDRRPREIYAEEISGYASHDMSYHHGAKRKQITIHIKNRHPKEGEPRYKSLPLSNILPPSGGNDFPLPLLKIEIPSCVVEASKEYKEKKYHHKVDIHNSNVVEIYMTNERYRENVKRFARIWGIYFGMSLEYFCTNTIISGAQKAHSYIPHEPEIRSATSIGLNGMELMVNFYPEPQLDLHRKAMFYSFIENKFAEDILLNTILVYPQAGADGTFPRFYAGGCTLKDLQVLTGKDNSPGAQRMFGEKVNETGERIHRYTATQATVNMDRVAFEESVYLAKKAKDSADRLYYLMLEHNDSIERSRKQLIKKCGRFVKALKRERKNAWQSNSSDAVTRWLRADPAVVEEATYTILSLYLGLDETRLGACVINDQFKHCWLLYDENWDVDICGDVLNRFLAEGDSFRYPDIHISVGLDPTYTVPNVREDTSRIRDRCQMKPLGYTGLNVQERDAFLDQDDELLRKVYAQLLL